MTGGAPRRRSRPLRAPRRQGPAPEAWAGDLRQWAASAPVALALVDEQLRSLWVNAAFETLSGYTSAQALGNPLPGLLAEPLSTPWDLGDPGPQRRVLYGRDGHGIVCDVHATASAPGRWLLTLQPREIERALDTELRRTDGLLRFVLDSLGIGTFEHPVGSGSTRWDERMFRFWGRDPAQGVPDLAACFETTLTLDGALDAFEQSLSRPGAHSHRFRMAGPGGRLRQMQARWQVLTTADGTPDRAVGLMVDDTETFDLALHLDNTTRQLQLATELSGLAVWRHDLATQRLHYDWRGWECLQLAPRDDGLSLDEVRDLIHPDDRAEVQACMERAMASNGPEDMQARYRRADGCWRHVLTRRVTQRDARGRPVAFMGVALDITDQVERMQQARDLERQLDDVAADSGVGIWRMRRDGGPAEWNQQMYAISGLDPQAPPPRLIDWVARCVHPQDRARVLASTQAWKKAPDSRTEIAHRMVLPDGRVRHVVARGRPEPAGSPFRLAGVMIDVTEREQALAAWRVANERSTLAARAAGIGIWEWDPATATSSWDAQMFTLRGLAPQDHAPSLAEMSACVHPDDLAVMRHRVAAVSRHRDPATYEFRIIRPDGQVRWLASRSMPVFDADGRTTRRVGVNWDVTESREAERARQERAVAQRESRAKSELLARMSHELRTPMNAVLGFARLLLDEEPDPSSLRHRRLEYIRSAGEHLLTLINDVLELSRPEAGGRSLQLADIPLADICTQTLAMVEHLAAERQVQLDLAVGDELVHADPTRLKQVLMNLLTNAIKYNRVGGRVRLQSCAEPDGHAQAGTSPGVRLSVHDTGQGMTDEQTARVFDAFYRAAGDSQSVEGTGIGLTIARALVDRMGGHIDVQSVPGEGSVFGLWLPAATGEARVDGGVASTGAHEGADVADPLDAVWRRPEPESVQAPRPVPGTATDAPPGPAARLLAGIAAGGGSKRLLYIEDNPVNVLIVSQLVMRRGDILFESAADGRSGVELARAWQPQFVLVDMHLPDIQGLEVLARLRAHPETAHLPCVALSANVLQADIDLALAAGFDDYWTKPVDFDRFNAMLDRVFGPAPARDWPAAEVR